ASAKAKTVNGERQIQALVDKKKVIITETSIKSDLKLDDAEGTYCLPTATIFEELERMGKLEGGVKFLMYPRHGEYFTACPIDSHSTPIHTQPSSSKPQKKKSRRKQRKDSGPTEPIPDEAINEEHVATPSCDPPQSGEDRMQLTELMDLFYQGESSNDVNLGAQEDASKQGRKIDDLDADAEVTLVDETREMNDDNLMFDTGVLEEQEKEVVEKEVSAADLVTIAGEVATTANVEVTIANALNNPKH
ncbi:hypothetical protein Tco_0828291, partial [Tanacetum coccineum]